MPWSEAAERVDSLAHGLLARGVKKGDRVAVLSRTRLEWILLDWAVMSIGAVVVGQSCCAARNSGRDRRGA